MKDVENFCIFGKCSCSCYNDLIDTKEVPMVCKTCDRIFLMYEPKFVKKRIEINKKKGFPSGLLDKMDVIFRYFGVGVHD